MKSLLIKSNNQIEIVNPANHQTYSLHELKMYVGGYIEIVTLYHNKMLVCNEEGKLKGLPTNLIATILFKDFLLPDDFIVGDVLIIDSKQID